MRIYHEYRLQVGSLELEQSAFGSATVRQVMDMTAALDYNENYADPKSDNTPIVANALESIFLTSPEVIFIIE